LAYLASICLTHAFFSKIILAIECVSRIEIWVYIHAMQSEKILAPKKSKVETALTEKQLEIVECLVTGMNQTEAAKFVGVSREYVCRLCQQDHFLQEIDNRVQRLKTLLAPRALANVAKMAEVAKSERVRLDANLGILDRTGHGRADANVISMKHSDVTIHIDLS
jgi:hypothetical protein